VEMTRASADGESGKISAHDMIHRDILRLHAADHAPLFDRHMRGTAKLPSIPWATPGTLHALSLLSANQS